MTLLGMLAREAKVAVLITDSDAEPLVARSPILYLRDGKLVNRKTHRSAAGSIASRRPRPPLKRSMLDLVQARKYYASPGGEVHAVDDRQHQYRRAGDRGDLRAERLGQDHAAAARVGPACARTPAACCFEGEDVSKMPKRDVLAYRRTSLASCFRISSCPRG
jgi:hypothetical protein